MSKAILIGSNSHTEIIAALASIFRNDFKFPSGQPCPGSFAIGFFPSMKPAGFKSPEEQRRCIIDYMMGQQN